MNHYFIEIPRTENSGGWVKYAYRNDYLDKVEDTIKLACEISPKVLDHFMNTEHEKFNPLAKDIGIFDFLSRTEFRYESELYKMRYLWTNGSLIVRQGTLSDIEGILNLLHPANVEASGNYTASHMEKILSWGLMIVLTDYENKIKGFKTLSTRRNKLGGRELLYIQDDARKQGAFRVIWELTFDAARYAGFSVVLTQCTEQNPVAKMYEHIGFRRKEKTKKNSYTYRGQRYTNVTVMFEREILREDQQTFF